MSAAAATAAPAGAVPAKGGKKKLIVIVVAVLLLVVVGGGAAFLLMKKKPAAEGEGDEAPVAHASEGHGEDGKPDLKHPPTFVPLEPFVVNLSDRDTDRYAQVGITFEIADAKFAEQIKPFMPAIRNGILLILSHKSSKDLLDRDGKEKLAGEIQRESARTVGIEVEDPDEDEGKPTAADGEDAKPKKKKKKRRAPPPNPIQHVHFSNFIVQ